MMVRLHLVTPTRLRLEVLARLNNNGISEIPFQGRAVKVALVWHRLAAEYFALYLMDRRHHLRTICLPIVAVNIRHCGWTLRPKSADHAVVAAKGQNATSLALHLERDSHSLTALEVETGLGIAQLDDYVECQSARQEF